MNAQSKCTATGFVIEPLASRRILTNAHAVANQVRRETEWLGRKAAARTRKAASRIDDALERRGELDREGARLGGDQARGRDRLHGGAGAVDAEGADEVAAGRKAIAAVSVGASYTVLNVNDPSYAYTLTPFGGESAGLTSSGVPPGGPAGTVVMITKPAGAGR